MPPLSLGNGQFELRVGRTPSIASSRTDGQDDAGLWEGDRSMIETTGVAGGPVGGAGLRERDRG